MAWGKAKVPKPPRSALSKVAPLIIFLLIVFVFAFVAYQMYLSAQMISSAATDKMHAKHIHMNKDGVTVEVKGVDNEHYVDNAQGLVVKAWNLSSWPGYKSRLWNQEAEVNTKSRKSFPRTSSHHSTH